MQNIIVKKDEFKIADDRKGYLRVIGKIEDEIFQKADNEIFPNKCQIFVNSDFDQIDKKFSDNDLFIITEVIESYNFQIDSPSSAKYTTTGYKAERIKRHQLCKIVEKEFDPLKPFRLVSEVEPNSYLYIKSSSDNFIYGPFFPISEKIDEDDYNITLRPVIHSDLNLSNDLDKFIFKFNIGELSSHIISIDSVNYIFNTLNLLSSPNISKDAIYYGNNEDLLEWGKKNIIQVSNVDERIFKDILPSLNDIPSENKFDKIKLERLKNLLKGTESWLVSGLPKFIHNYLNSTDGQAYLKDFLDKNRNTIVEKYDLEIELRKNKIEELSGVINSKNLEIVNIQQDPRYNNISQESQKLIKDLIDSEEKSGPIQELLNKYELADKAERIEGQIFERERKKGTLDLDIKKRNEEKTILENDLKNLKANFKDSEEVKNTLLKLKPYVDFLNGVVPNYLPDDSQNQISSIYPIIRNTTPNSLEEYLNDIQTNLLKVGREIEFNDLANYLINIHQNFISVFAGLPGVGKTSLITKLADSLGYKERFLSVSVSRGWTSAKDFIGYFNPLTSQFQPSKTNFYKEVVERYKKEMPENIDIPYLVLLDEANLSPIEHYWSDFMKFTDPESDKIISLGGKEEYVQMGNGLRFIATINYDHTTEILSPRLIDRSPIILLNSKKDLIENIEIQKLPSVNEYYSFNQLENIFNNKRESLKEDERLLFIKIKEDLETVDNNLGTPIIISPRKQNQIFNFCSVARPIFKDEANQFTALDYAVKQHVLPLINGRGDKFGKRLDGLSKTLERHLPKTSQMLYQIINSGANNYHNYRFFC